MITKLFLVDPRLKNRLHCRSHCCALPKDMTYLIGKVECDENMLFDENKSLSVGTIRPVYKEDHPISEEDYPVFDTTTPYLAKVASGGKLPFLNCRKS